MHEDVPEAVAERVVLLLEHKRRLPLVLRGVELQMKVRTNLKNVSDFPSTRRRTMLTLSVTST